MKTALNPQFTARQPRQQRAKDRIAIVLQEAEALILETGLAEFSIPVLAERLGYPRATIYKFFPTPYALINALSERHLAALEADLVRQGNHLREARDWREAATRMVQLAAQYYRSHPAACRLLLGGPVSDFSYRALEYTIARLGTLTRALLAERGLKLPPGAPDVAALAVEFGTASFRMSYFLHGEITPEYTQAAADVMVAFIEKRLGMPAA